MSKKKKRPCRGDGASFLSAYPLHTLALIAIKRKDRADVTSTQSFLLYQTSQIS